MTGLGVLASQNTFHFLLSVCTQFLIEGKRPVCSLNFIFAHLSPADPGRKR